MIETLTVYIDYKSPYAYLAVEPTRALARDLGLAIEWAPYSLQIDQYLGDVEDRNAHQWRRVRYSYMDARRLANEVGLIVRGPQKLFDSTIAHVGMLYVRDADHDALERYHDFVFERFFKRELDIEDMAAVAAVIDEVGVSGKDFDDYFHDAGSALLDRTLRDAEDRLGVFGVPTYVVGDEIFWGGDRLAQVRRRIEERRHSEGAS